MQPLSIPDKFGGKKVILVVVDRLGIYAHFLPLSHTYTTMSVAQLFMDNVFKLHGVPNNIAFDKEFFLALSRRNSLS